MQAEAPGGPDDIFMDFTSELIPSISSNDFAAFCQLVGSDQFLRDAEPPADLLESKHVIKLTDYGEPSTETLEEASIANLNQEGQPGPASTGRQNETLILERSQNAKEAHVSASKSGQTEAAEKLPLEFSFDELQASPLQSIAAGCEPNQGSVDSGQIFSQ